MCKSRWGTASAVRIGHCREVSRASLRYGFFLRAENFENLLLDFGGKQALNLSPGLLVEKAFHDALLLSPSEFAKSPSVAGDLDFVL